MEPSVRQRRTRENRCADLRHRADFFIRLCDSNELRMRHLLEDLQDVCAKLQRLRSRSETCSVAGTVTAAVGLGAAVAAIVAQVTGGLSLAVTAAAGYVAAAAAAVTLRAQQFSAEEERVKKVKEFLEVVSVLHGELENIAELCEDLQSDADDAEDVGRIYDVLRPLLAAAPPGSAARLESSAELSAQCERVFGQFRSTKRKLEEIRGRGDAEKVQEEEE